MVNFAWVENGTTARQMAAHASRVRKGKGFAMAQGQGPPVAQRHRGSVGEKKLRKGEDAQVGGYELREIDGAVTGPQDGFDVSRQERVEQVVGETHQQP